MKQPFQSEIDDVLKHLMDKLFYIAVPLGCIAFTAGIIRSLSYGWQLGIAVDITTFAAMIIILALRRRLPVPVTVGALIAAVAIAGAGALFSLGLAGTGLTVIATLAIFIGIFYGIRPGITIIGMVLLCVFSFRGAISLGLLPFPSVDANQLLRSPLTWVTQSLTFAVYSVAVILAAHSVQQRLIRSLTDLNERTGELQDTILRLRESEEKYRLLSENVTDVVAVQDMDLKLTYVSPSVEKMFGYRIEETINQSMKDWLTPESLRRAFDSFQKYLALAMEGPVSVPLMEFEYVRKDGSTFWGELCTTFLYDRDGKPSGSQSVLRDITERRKNEEQKRQLEEQLNHNEKMRIIGQLAGGVAHDFNNQLAGMMGFADLILHHDQAGEEIRKFAGSIITSARRSADLTSKLLAFAHRGKIRSEPVDMHMLIAETVAILERSVDKRICIRQRLEAADHTILGDSTQLQNALLNLCLNARDAMPDGGELIITTSRKIIDHTVRDHDGAIVPPGTYLEICVIDNGIGIDPVSMSHIFEPFFSTKERGKGTGMGLPAVLGTIRSHKGTIAIDSTQGKGTKVTLRLPLTATIVAEDRNTKQPAAPCATGTLLVIDDEPTVLELARLVLTRAGYKIHAFGDPAEATTFYREQGKKIDLVICDMIMPKMDGVTVLTALHKLNTDLHAIVYSGYNLDHQMEHLKEIGVRGFIRKPFDSMALVAEVSRILAGKELLM